MNIAAFGQIIQHKRGDDFRQRVELTLSPTADLAAPAPDVRAGAIGSQIRTASGELLATCAVEFISGTPTRRIRQWR